MSNEQALHALGGTKIMIDWVLYWTTWEPMDPKPKVDRVSYEARLELPADAFATLQSRGLAGVTAGNFWCFVRDVP